MADGVAIADAAGRVIFVNEAGRHMAGESPLGLPVESYLEPFHILTAEGQPYAPDQLPLVRAFRDRETVVEAEWRIQRTDGTEVVVQGSATPVEAEDGTLLGAVSTFRDVTPQRTSERQREDFLAAAAHDLKAPLTAIKGFAQLLERRANVMEPAEVRERAARIDATTSRMTALLNQLLDATHIQMGRRLELSLHPTDLVALARQVAEDAREGTQTHSIQVQAAVPQLIGMWDATRLERVLENLLSNAINYSPNGGRITVIVSLEQAGEEAWAMVVVEDSGLGIPPADLPHIFERFYRARNVAGGTSGTGIGLAGVRQIVDQHGGTITVESREGKGTTFTVRLPPAPAAAMPIESAELHTIE